MLVKVFSINTTATEVIKRVPMKTKTFRRLVGYISAAALCVWMSAPALAQSQTNKLRIGVYDSRAIAIAYGNSAEFQQSLKSIHAEYNKAKEEKNDKRMKEIEAQMKLGQRRLHEQGFSTGSVAGFMVKIKDSLPVVAKKAGVQIIVSKWELNHRSPDVEVVEVTDELVALFHPSEKVLGWVKDLKSHPPLPIEEITDDMD
jgi:NAD(P)H-dependent flavin oxidoreductase YrpB (nitropropane dioxygenase family)